MVLPDEPGGPTRTDPLTVNARADRATTDHLTMTDLVAVVSLGPALLVRHLLDPFTDDRPQDSTTGKLMEKVGGMLGSDKIAGEGSEKRHQAGGNDNY